MYRAALMCFHGYCLLLQEAASDSEKSRTVTGDYHHAWVDDLHGYVNYTVTVSALNSAGSSPPSDPQLFTTRSKGSDQLDEL